MAGFVNTREMFRRAYEGRFAIPAFNFVCLEQLLAITDACMESRSPFILQCSANVRRGIGPGNGARHRRRLRRHDGSGRPARAR